MMMWPHSAPWLCRPSMIMPSTTIPQPIPVPSVNITWLRCVLAGTDPEFTIGRGVGVVLQGRRLLQPIGEPLPDRKVVPARQVGRVEEHAGLEVHRPGRAEPDGGDSIPVQAAFLDGLVGGLDERVEARLSRPRRRGSRC